MVIVIVRDVKKEAAGPAVKYNEPEEGLSNPGVACDFNDPVFGTAGTDEMEKFCEHNR